MACSYTSTAGFSSLIAKKYAWDRTVAGVAITPIRRVLVASAAADAPGLMLLDGDRQLLGHVGQQFLERLWLQPDHDRHAVDPSRHDPPRRLFPRKPRVGRLLDPFRDVLVQLVDVDTSVTIFVGMPL